MKRYYTAFYALLLAIAPSACAMHGGQSPSSALPPVTDSVIQPFDTHGGIAKMSVDMGDAAPVFAGNLAHVNIAISEIDVSGNSGHNTVVAQYSSPLIIDVLQYQHGSGGNVGSTQVNEKTYQNVRFVVDLAHSSIVFGNGATSALTFAGNGDSSSAHAGKNTDTQTLDSGRVAITVREPFTLGSSANALLHVDFNLLESLLPAGSNKSHGISPMDTHGGVASFCLRPTLFLAADWNAGSITGQVLNAYGQPVSNAVVVAVGIANQIGNTVATDSYGNFDLSTLPAGTYRLNVYNQYTTAAGVDISSSGSTLSSDLIRSTTITVGSGQTADAGTISD